LWAIRQSVKHSVKRSPVEGLDDMLDPHAVHIYTDGSCKPNPGGPQAARLELNTQMTYTATRS
jgi:hypothetical protein